MAAIKCDRSAIVCANVQAGFPMIGQERLHQVIRCPRAAHAGRDSKSGDIFSFRSLLWNLRCDGSQLSHELSGGRTAELTQSVVQADRLPTLVFR